MNKSIYKNVYSITGKQQSENEIMQFHLNQHKMIKILINNKFNKGTTSFNTLKTNKRCGKKNQRRSELNGKTTQCPFPFLAFMG